MKWFKKILAVCSFCTLLTTVNCFAVTMEETKITEDRLKCYKTYQVMESEKDTFLEILSKEFGVEFYIGLNKDKSELTEILSKEIIELNVQ